MREREGHLKLYILLSALHPLIDEIDDLKRATANDIEVIPEPILSRMHVVQVGHLSRAQLLKIVDGIYRGLVQKLGCNTMGEMPLDMVGAALMRSLREAKVRLECANASAVI